MKQHAPALAVLSAAVLWSLISIFVRWLTALGFDSIQIVAGRCLLSALLCFFLLLWKDKSLLRVRLKDLWLFAGTGLLSMVFFNWCYFTTIRTTGAGVAVVLLYTSPIWVMLFSALFFREKIGPAKLLALLCTFIGCVLVAGYTGGDPLNPLGVLIGVCSGLGYALYSIFGQAALNRGYQTLTVTAYTFFFAAAGCLVLTSPLQLFRLCLQPAAFGEVLGNTVLCSILPYLLYTWGLARMEAGRAAILATAEPLSATLIGIFLWGEPLTPAKCAGVALIFAAVALLNRKKAPSSL